MQTFTMVYQPDQTTGTPKLKSLDGGMLPFSPEETRELESLLAKNYNDLSRSKKQTIEFRSRQFQVTAEDNTRMPKLVLREGTQALVPTRPVPPSWIDGFLAEISQQAALAGTKLDDFEQNQLEYAMKHFQTEASKTSSVLTAFVLMAAYLGSMEQHTRLTDPSRATLYATALKSLEKLLLDADASVDVRQLTVVIQNTPQPEGVLKRVIHNIFGSR